MGDDHGRRSARGHPTHGDSAVAVVVVPLVALVAPSASNRPNADTTWTPYYKVHTTPIGDSGGVVAEVNGVPTWLQFRAVGNPLYETVYERFTAHSPGEVLIIGAGSGNDVAVALARGATSVDAVEIDAHLLEVGRTHPDRPTTIRASTPTSPTDGHSSRHRSPVGHDSARLARFPDPAPGPVVGAAGELPVHRRGCRRTANTSPTAARSRCTTTTASRGSWTATRRRSPTSSATTRASAPPAPARSCRCSWSATIRVRSSARPARGSTPPVTAPAPATDDHPFPYLRTPEHPRVLRGRHRRHPRLSIIAVRSARRTVPPIALPRPVLHGSGVPPARDEERRAVRPAVRDDVARQRLRVRRRAACVLLGGGGQQAGAHRAALARSTSPCSGPLPVNWWGCWLDLPVVARLLAAVGRSRRSSSPTSCSPSASATPRRDRGVRRQPPRGDARWPRRVPSLIVGYRHLCSLSRAPCTPPPSSSARPSCHLADAGSGCSCAATI